MFPTLSIANRILDEGDKLSLGISPMKLQKLLYYAHGWWLAIKGEPLIDEPIEAWQYGPVVPVVYREFRNFGNRPITERATEFDIENFEVKIAETPKDKELDQLISQIFRIYGHRSAIELSEMTHAAGTPWDKTFKKSNPTDSPRLNNDEIRQYFLGLLEKSKKKQEDTSSA